MSIKQRELNGNDESFVTLEPPVTQLLQQGYSCLAFPNSSTNWRPSIQVYEPVGPMFIQTATDVRLMPPVLLPQGSLGLSDTALTTSSNS